jgi:hypothetical protein
VFALLELTVVFVFCVLSAFCLRFVCILSVFRVSEFLIFEFSLNQKYLLMHNNNNSEEELDVAARLEELGRQKRESEERNHAEARVRAAQEFLANPQLTAAQAAQTTLNCIADPELRERVARELEEVRRQKQQADDQGLARVTITTSTLRCKCHAGCTHAATPNCAGYSKRCKDRIMRGRYTGLSDGERHAQKQQRIAQRKAETKRRNDERRKRLEADLAEERANQRRAKYLQPGKALQRKPASSTSSPMSIEYSSQQPGVLMGPDQRDDRLLVPAAPAMTSHMASLAPSAMLAPLSTTTAPLSTTLAPLSTTCVDCWRVTGDRCPTCSLSFCSNCQDLHTLLEHGDSQPSKPSYIEEPDDSDVQEMDLQDQTGPDQYEEHLEQLEADHNDQCDSDFIDDGAEMLDLDDDEE